MSLTLDACVAQHIGDRKEQQDRAGLFQHAKLKKIVLAVVADGMGGHTGGALAAEQVVHTARTSLDQFSPNEEPASKMLDSALREAHMMIRSGRFLNEQDPHSTGVMLMLQPKEDQFLATWAHCGDSRLYHFRGEALVMHTIDHSYVEDLVKQGKLSRELAAIHPRKNVLITSLGGEDEPIVDCASSADLRGGDTFLLCSDGLWGYFEPEELGKVLATRSAREAAGILIDGARERAKGKGDNCTLAIVKLIEFVEKAPAPPAPPVRPR